MDNMSAYVPLPLPLPLNLMNEFTMSFPNLIYLLYKNLGYGLLI
jgi:hypothetical protein